MTAMENGGEPVLSAMSRQSKLSPIAVIHMANPARKLS